MAIAKFFLIRSVSQLKNLFFTGFYVQKERRHEIGGLLKSSGLQTKENCPNSFHNDFCALNYKIQA